MWREWGRRPIYIGYWSESQRERDRLEDQDAGEWITLIWILELG
jgi:hypothetical protein